MNNKTYIFRPIRHDKGIQGLILKWVCHSWVYLDGRNLGHIDRSILPWRWYAFPHGRGWAKRFNSRGKACDWLASLPPDSMASCPL